MSDRNKLVMALGLLFVVITLFLFYDLGRSWEFALKLRGVKVLAMLIVSFSISYSTIAFQTITGNRILTPSIMGFESVYLLTQTVIVFLYGSESSYRVDNISNFIISIGAMIGFAAFIYTLIYRRGGNNLYFLLLVGIILGTLLNSLSSFMQLVIDPHNFFIVQGKMFASFNKINEGLLLPTSMALAITLAIGYRSTKYLDLLALGREHAINLGIGYNRAIQFFLALVAILVAISTALVGPITFLGLLVSNLTYELFRSYRHSLMITASTLISSITLIGGQWMMERVFHFSTPVSTIINLVGGIYFMYLLLRLRTK